MFARINFLAGLGMLILTAFYLVSVYLILASLSKFAPVWIRFATGASVLLAMGFTVQLLASAMTGMAGVAKYVSGRTSPTLFAAAQSALVAAHICVIYGLTGLLYDDIPVSNGLISLTTALYLAGVSLSLYEWKQRTASSR